MEYLMRGKWIFNNAKTKHELISALNDRIEFLEALPDDIGVNNANDGSDDYIFLSADPKDKDDRKYLQKLGFRKEEIE